MALNDDFLYYKQCNRLQMAIWTILGKKYPEFHNWKIDQSHIK